MNTHRGMIVSADEQTRQFNVRVDADGGGHVTIQSPFKGACFFYILI